MTSEQTVPELLEQGEQELFEAAFRTGDFAKTSEVLQAAHERAVRHSDRAGAAAAAQLLGMERHYESISRLIGGLEVPAADIDAEEALFRQALESRESIGDAAGTAQSLFGLGLVFQVLRRDWAAAMPLFSRALEIVEALGDLADAYTRSEIHRHVGFYFLVEDVQPEEAVRHLRTSLELRERIGDPRLIPAGLVALGEAQLAAGRPQEAVELLQQAARLAGEAGLLDVWIRHAEQACEEAQAALRHPPAEDATTPPA